MGITVATLLCLLQTPPATTPHPEFEAVPFTEYLAGFSSPVEESRRWIITNETELQNYWAEGLGRNPKDAPKSVDFHRYGLVAIHLGSRATGGYNVYVKAVTKLTPDTALVSYIEQKPRPLAVVVSHRTSPWVLFKVPAGMTQFSFKAYVQTIKYPPVRDNAQPGKPDPDTVPHPEG